MSLEPVAGFRSASPASSGRSSPVPRASRRAVEDGVYKADKSLRRYGAVVDRALSTWETAPQQWADYIAFLARLLKAIQSHPKDVPLLPHSAAVASKLSQCLNPALPSGVHQKALEVYRYIFSNFGEDHIASNLHEYLPGLSSVLSFASLSVRPGLYSLYEDYIVSLPPSELRPALKSLTLSLLPALEDETSEDFQRAFGLLDSLQRAFVSHEDDAATAQDSGGYFWQCLFLAVISSPSRRQGAINYLTHKLPMFALRNQQPATSGSEPPNGGPSGLSAAAEAAISPEPGLLIRAFASGLSDPQILIQRAFLDLLATNLPLHSPVLQDRIADVDLDRLTSAAVSVLLRRDMSLNRRLWSWFLGPGPRESGVEAPFTESKPSLTDASHPTLNYFVRYGRMPLQRCLLAMLEHTTPKAVDTARPFRVCLSLMDRREIGGLVISELFLPAMQSAYEYSLHASKEELEEVMRSASLFFDGVETQLIWASLHGLLRSALTAENVNTEELEMFNWITRHFNIKEQEMLFVHIPCHALYVLDWLATEAASKLPAEPLIAAMKVAHTLLDHIPPATFVSHAFESSAYDSGSQDNVDDVQNILDEFYAAGKGGNGKTKMPLGERRIARCIHESLKVVVMRSMHGNTGDILKQAVSALIQVRQKAPFLSDSPSENLMSVVEEVLNESARNRKNLPFSTLSCTVSLLVALSSPGSPSLQAVGDTLASAGPALTAQIWAYLSPIRPKFHVEAVKLLWQLDELTETGELLSASLNSFLRNSKTSDDPATEAARRFQVLWVHTLVTRSVNTRRDSRGVSRMGSSMTSSFDPEASHRRRRVLMDPLMLMLDALNDSADAAFAFIKAWLQSVPNLDEIHRILLEQMINISKSVTKLAKGNDEAAMRYHHQRNLDLAYVLQQVHSILKYSSGNMWQTFGGVTMPNREDGTEIEAVLLLAQTCNALIVDGDRPDPGLGARATDILEVLLTGPLAINLKPVELESAFLDKLINSLTGGSTQLPELQGSLLGLIRSALKVRLQHVPETKELLVADRDLVGTLARRIGSEKSKQQLTLPPAQLLKCLQLGFSSDRTRYQLGQWLEFLAEILPTFADAIFSNLIPLVDTFCQQLTKVFEELVLTSQRSTETSATAPEATIIGLLDGLDMILARAHECLLGETLPEALPSQTEPPSGVKSLTLGMFQVQGPPSRTSKANSRLTVILTFQDAVRVCLKMWTWASRGAEDEANDRDSAATTAYNGLKVRNRSRHLLEQISSVEPLESLEVVIYEWSHASSPEEARITMSLLQVMTGSRPKNNLPAILDALCSRTNPAAVTAVRQSSLTSNLTAMEVVTFLSAYLESVEDDAMDEVWPDCTAFMRDVLANPLPYRQVLPALLSLVLLLAEKVANTNYGEQTKMKRELGDIFQRLLAATFTTLPSGFIVESTSNGAKSGNDSKTYRSTGNNITDLVLILNQVTVNMEMILETHERVTGAINNISSNVISPLFRAKSFPWSLNAEVLALVVQMSRKAPAAKSWKKDVADAFNDPRLLTSPLELMESGWLPVLQQWCMSDKERMIELLSRLSPPTSAGIMFGVGASAARLEADRRTQLNLRRACLLLLCAPEDTHVMHLRTIEEKLVELAEATQSSSPSCAIKAELYMLCRAVVLSLSAVQIAPIWPVINESLQSALTSLFPGSSTASAFTNFAILQACKLLDMLILLSPDDFQLHEWLYITDTIDAVYHPIEWTPVSLADRIAEELGSGGFEGSTTLVPATPVATSTPEMHQLLLNSDLGIDKDDVKALSREDFVRTVLRPFLNQLSMHAYEGTYSMDRPDVSACRRSLLEDLLDLGTIVE